VEISFAHSVVHPFCSQFSLPPSIALASKNHFWFVPFWLSLTSVFSGQSEGNHQMIRTYPTTFVTEVVTALGKKQAEVLMGHSQGGQAIFNVALEKPSLVKYLVQVSFCCVKVVSFDAFFS
jgi:pimeloyl-ACP methyl ester carboxylesterase